MAVLTALVHWALLQTKRQKRVKELMVGHLVLLFENYLHVFK